jgi:hypothetical protein
MTTAEESKPLEKQVSFTCKNGMLELSDSDDLVIELPKKRPLPTSTIE